MPSQSDEGQGHLFPELEELGYQEMEFKDHILQDLTTALLEARQFLTVLEIFSIVCRTLKLDNSF